VSAVGLDIAVSSDPVTVNQILSVTVTRTADGSQVEGAFVRYILTDGGTPIDTLTDASGISTFKPPLAGTLDIIAAKADEGLSGTGTVNVVEVAGLDIAVSPDPAIVNQILSVTVTRTADSSQVEGAFVRYILNGGTPIDTFTDASGISTFKPRLTGTLVIIATKADESCTRTVEVVEAGVNLTINRTIAETKPNKNATYLLTVKNTGALLDNYTLTVYNQNGATTANLSLYQTPDIAPGHNITALLNVTSETEGVFIVVVKVTSSINSNVNDTVSTTTTVIEAGHSAYTIHLTPDYNLISIPLNDISITDAQSLVGKINTQGGNCIEVMSWNGVEWLSYAPPDPLNNVIIEGGKGYFVHVTEPSDVTFVGTAWTN